MRILVIEDDKDTRDFLQATLAAESYAVDTAADGAKGSYLARTNDYDLILLDNGLPLKSGVEVCRDIRGSGKHVPILMLSVLGDPDEKAKLLDAGADDYLSKPYSHKELRARIRALTRRGPEVAPTTYTCGNIVLDCDRQEARSGKKKLYLTRKEFSLLELLMQNQGRVVTRGAIMERVWDMEGNPFSKTLETHMVNLRKKIETAKEKIITTVPGRGYTIDC